MSEMYVNRLLLRFTLSVDLDIPLTKGYSTLCTKQPINFVLTTLVLFWGILLCITERPFSDYKKRAAIVADDFDYVDSRGEDIMTLSW